jgi:hypothetical protein
VRGASGFIELSVEDEWAWGEIKGSFFMSGNVSGDDGVVIVISTDLTKTT